MRVYFLVNPSQSLQYKSVAPYMKGIAQLAADALQISTFGAVRQFSNLSGSYCDVPVTVMFKMTPNLSQAYWKVQSPMLSLRNYYKTLMSNAHPSLPALLNCLNRFSRFWLAKAAKLKVPSSKSSSLVCVAMTEAMMLPALLPAITLGKQSASIRACTTPM